MEIKNEVSEKNETWEKLKFWFFLNCLILSAIFIYQSYGVIFQGKILTYQAPRLYGDTEFLLEEFWGAYDIRLANNTCQPVLRTKEDRLAFNKPSGQK